MNIRRNAVFFIFMLIPFFSAISASAQSLDLMPYARVAATDTFNSFLMLWPRETDDGAFTIRDGAVETSWKISFTGTTVLQIDFAPAFSPIPALSIIEPDWETPPQGSVRVIAMPYCGGPTSLEKDWGDPTSPFTFAQPLRARCLNIEFNDAGYAALRELKVLAEDTGESPAVSNVEVAPAEMGLQIAWTPNKETGLIRIDYLYSADEPVSDETLVEIVPARKDWYGPWPVTENARIVVTPLALSGVAGEPVLLDPTAVDDLPFYPYMGTIEGFYGTLWSDGERRRMMSMIARLGFGSYLYQPKWDLLNREQWRTPYSAEQIAAFAALHRFGERIGVTMIFGLGPAFDMIVDDPDERAVLLDKLSPLVEAGFRDFELGFDDIEFSVADPVNGVMGAKHVDLVNWTQDQLSAMAGEPVDMWMMPTPYSTDRQYNSFPEGSDYIDQLINLHDGIHILWNGPDTFAREISAADLEDVTERTGRKPVIWENMHCNDAGDAFIGKLYLAPLMKRSSDMPDAVEGFMTNPLIMGAGNRLVYGSYEQYFTDPAAYDPNNAMPESVGMEVTSETDRSLALRLSDNYWGLGILGPPGSSVTRNRPMEDAMDALRDALAENELSSVVNAGSRLLKVAAQMASTPNDLHHSGFRTDLVDDLWYPADRLYDEGRTLLRLMEWLGERLAGSDDPAALEDAEYRILDSLLHDRYHTSLLRLFFFKRQLVNFDPGALGFEPPIIAEPKELTATVGDKWVYDPETNSDISVHGLPGSTQTGSLVNWQPIHAGAFHVLIAAQGAKGWAWREFLLTVQDAAIDDDAIDDDAVDDDSISDDDTENDGDEQNDENNDDGCGC